MPAGKVTGTNREVEAVVAASFAARTAASRFRDRKMTRPRKMPQRLPQPGLNRGRLQVAVETRN